MFKVNVIAKAASRNLVLERLNSYDGTLPYVIKIKKIVILINIHVLMNLQWISLTRLLSTLLKNLAVPRMKQKIPTY